MRIENHIGGYPTEVKNQKANPAASSKRSQADPDAQSVCSKKPRSDAGSVRASHCKTVATDQELIKEALSACGRLG